MAITGRAFILIFYATVFKTLQGSGVIEFQLLHYNSTQGYCCDYQATIGSNCNISRCNFAFELCLRNPADGRNCSFGHGRAKINGTLVEFYQDNTTSPESQIMFLNNNYKGNLMLIITKLDEDGKENNSKQLDRMFLNFTFSPAFNGNENRLKTTISGNLSRMSLTIIMRCGLWHYGDDCTVICDLRSHPHLLCDEKGNKTCQSGWSGLNCDKNIDDCEGHSCQNGGTCQDLINGYECKCLAEYSGVHCERLKDCDVNITGKNFSDQSVSVAVSGSFNLRKFEQYLQSWNNDTAIRNETLTGNFREFSIYFKTSFTVYNATALVAKLHEFCRSRTLQEQREESSKTMANETSKGPIVGGIVGGLVAAVVLALAGIFIYKRKLKSKVHDEKVDKECAEEQTNNKAEKETVA